jgi:hypothetical protein
MKKNIGSKDRVIRLVAGSIIILSGLYYQSWWGALGLIPIATAFIHWCPVYVPFGISTCKYDPEKD